MCEKDIALSYQTMLDKCKVTEWAVLFWQKARRNEPFPTEVATATVNVLKAN